MPKNNWSTNVFLFNERIEKVNLKFEKISLIKLSLDNMITIVRSSLIGFISGLIPYVGNGISSNLAFNIEKKINPNNFIAQATASESANNSANTPPQNPSLHHRYICWYLNDQL